MVDLTRYLGDVRVRQDAGITYRVTAVKIGDSLFFRLDSSEGDSVRIDTKNFRSLDKDISISTDLRHALIDNERVLKGKLRDFQ